MDNTQAKPPTSSELTTLLPRSSGDAIPHRLKATLELMNAKPWTADALNIALDLLETFPVDRVFSALSRCALEIGGNGYQPTLALADITARLGVPTGKALEDAKTDAAWMQVLACLYVCSGYCGCGYYHLDERKSAAVQFDDAGKHAMRMIGGWARLQSTHVQNLHFVEKDFGEFYRSWEPMNAAVDVGALPEQVSCLLHGKGFPEPKRLVAAMPPIKKPEAAPRAVPVPPQRIQARNTKEALQAQLAQLASKYSSAATVGQDG